ncbi:response regulator [Lyngbya aestuarii]|uniref:response regulator n=1 Tax=Lyngbya aestuarii TaxID=118322 RepID=UPI00403D828A
MVSQDGSASPSASSLKEYPITVLLIDDQPMIGEAVRRMLAPEEDITFHYCSDPIQALQQATETNPTVILQDLVMPEVDGLLLLRFFRANENTSELPIIVLSVKEDAKLKADAFTAGANDYLVKLPDAVELIARIRYHSQAYINRLQRDEAYQASIESEQRLRRVLENMPVMMMAFDVTGTIIVWNGECERVTGYTAAEIVNHRHVRELLANSSNSVVEPSVSQENSTTVSRLLTPDSSEWEITCKDGSLKTVAWSNLGDRFPIPRWAGWGIGLDITERKRAEISLTKEYQQLRKVIDNAPIAMAMLDTQMRYLAYSNQWLIESQLPVNSLLGKCHYQLLPKQREKYQAIYQQALQGQFLSCAEDQWERSDGTAYYCRWAIQPWYTPENQVGGVIIVNHPINELVEAREAALETSRTKSQFLANMSHEIRTPMNGVLGMSELLLQTELGGKQKDYAKTISTSAKHLLSLINDILDFSKLEAGEMHLENINFNLPECVKESVSLMTLPAQNKDIKIITEFDINLPERVHGDPGKLRQILLNLVSNAIKFTPQGEIKIQTNLQSETQQDSTIYFAVTDTGIGIPPEALPKIFKSFSQVDASTSREYGGTGLGLAICQQLASIMGGEIGVDSLVNQGSTFWFTVKLSKPLYHQGIATSSTGKTDNLSDQDIEDARQPANIQKKLKILVAEDNLINQTVILSQLQTLGYEAECVANGSEALELLEKQDYDLVLMDCQMPVMDGYSAIQELRRRERNQEHTVVIALTANAMLADRQKCLGAGMDDYLSKPLEQGDLARVIRRWTTQGSVSNTNQAKLEQITPQEQLPNVEKEAIPQHETSPLIDFERLQRISRGKVARQQKLLEIFLNSAAQDAIALEEAILKLDYAQVAYYAHRLKGSSANVGIPPLLALAKKLEVMTKQQSLEGATEIVASLQQVMEQLQVAVKAFV